LSVKWGSLLVRGGNRWVFEEEIEGAEFNSNKRSCRCSFRIAIRSLSTHLPHAEAHFAAPEKLRGKTEIQH